jgi:cell division protein FtsL
MKKKILYIVIAILVLLNIGQFVYFYSSVSDLKSDIKIMESKLSISNGNSNNLKDNNDNNGNEEIVPGGEDDTVPQ